MKNQKQKKIFLLALISSTMLLLLFLIIPDWWKYASLKEFQEWYPAFGKGVYYVLHWFAPLLLCVCLITLFVTQLKNLCILFSYLCSKFKRIFLNAIPYSLQDVLGERRFVSNLFFRLLAFVYFVAFASLLWQFELVSENGLIPYKEFVHETWLREGFSSLFVYPSIFWLNQSDWFIRLVLYSACAISAISVFFRASTISYFFLWITYLSIVNFGRDLFHFPWDTFLLEVGFLSVFTVYFINRLNWLPRLLLFALLLLFFRQWFSMGMVKALWGDPEWYDLTYMKYYWLNQPSPTPVAWYMYQLPMFLQRFFTITALLLEVLIPVSMLFGRKGRFFAFLGSLAVSFMIQLNGNFGFFNLLTAILGIWCLDDLFFKRKKKTFLVSQTRKINLSQGLCFILISITVGLNLFYVYLQFDKRSDHPVPYANYYFFDEQGKNRSGFIKSTIFEAGKAFSRFRIVCPHGVFRGIPKERQQVQIHIKTKGNDYWQSLTFKKGKDLTELYFISPVMNHLSLKFGAHWAYYTDFFFYLKTQPNIAYISSFKINLVQGILEKNCEIAKLIGPFPDGEVEQIRIYRIRKHVHEKTKSPFRYNAPEDQILDSLYISPNDKIDFSVFDHRYTPQ